MSNISNSLPLLQAIVDQVNMGIFVVDKEGRVSMWNDFMASHSGIKAEDIVGRTVHDGFADLPAEWLHHKIRTVIELKTPSFTSWEQRPYLLPFQHNRPITGGTDYMRQNCTFLPLEDESGQINQVCITIADVTDTSIYQHRLKVAVKSLAETSVRDGLTGTYNRRYLEQCLHKETLRARRYGSTYAFIILDLDHFKAVNDTYGHQAGDEVLRVAAERIQQGLRASDILGRYGGEEFALILPETSLDGAITLADRLREKLAETPVNFNGTDIAISASIGVSKLRDDTESHETLVSEADGALYQAKENGRNQVIAFDPERPSHNAIPQDGETIIEEQTEEFVNRVTFGYK